MAAKKKILAICGSTKRTSTNLGLIRAIATLFNNEVELEIFRGLADIPHFSPDLDIDPAPAAVHMFRKKLNDCAGILICTPEYAMGVPGSLKNAIDWTVSSMEFSHKPVALITASSSGEKAHRSLLETLKVIESEIPESSQLLISFIKTKVKGDEIIDEKTFTKVSDVVRSLLQTIDAHQPQTFLEIKENRR